MVGVVGSAFHDWVGMLREEKQLRLVKFEADKALKRYKDKNLSASAGVVERISGERTHSLLQQVMMVWIMSVSEMIRTNALQLELKKIIELHANMEANLRAEFGLNG